MRKNAHFSSRKHSPDLPWSDVPFFLALARATSLAGAARSLSMDRSTVSRRLEHLERKLEKPLFERKSGSFILTEFGRRALAAATHAEEALLQFGSSTDDFTYGQLTVTISEHLLVCYADHFAAFSLAHPEIHLNIVTSDRLLNLRRYEADIGFRLSRSAPPGIYHKRLQPVSFKIYRSKGEAGPTRRYIASPREQTISHGLRTVLPEAEIALTVDGVLAMRETIATGGGAGMLSSVLGDADPRLVAVTPPIHELPLNVAEDTRRRKPFFAYLLCLPEQKSLYRVRTFFSFMEKRIGARSKS